MELSVDTTLRLAEIVSILTGGAIIAYRIGRSTQRMELQMEYQRAEMADLRANLQELSKMMTEMALQKQRLDLHAAQLQEVMEAIRRRG